MTRRILVALLLLSALGSGPSAPYVAAETADAPILTDAGTPLGAAAADLPVRATDTSAPVPTDTATLGSIDLRFDPGGAGEIEILAEVQYPTNLAGGPYPLIVFLHGQHVTCHFLTPTGPDSDVVWPCPAGTTPIENYRGYGYLARDLASHGYIVASISANGVNARPRSEETIGDDPRDRAQLIQRHLEIWRAIHTGDWSGVVLPAAVVDALRPTVDSGSLARLRGRVDLTRIGLMGHSRGGEGVVRLFNDHAPGSPWYRIRAVFAIAPTDFTLQRIRDVPFGVLLPYCDGDVSTLAGTYLYDDSRYGPITDLGPKHAFLAMGGNHNFYNRIWTPKYGPPGSADDALRGPLAFDPYCGRNRPGRLSENEQELTTLKYLNGFLRVYVGGWAAFLPELTGERRPPGGPKAVHVSYHPPANRRATINGFERFGRLTTNNLGGRVTRRGPLAPALCGGGAEACLPGQPIERQPHTRPAFPLAKLVWTGPLAPAGPTSLTNELRRGVRDISGMRRLQFRVGVNFADARNPRPAALGDAAQDFRVVLHEADASDPTKPGRSASVLVSAHSAALFYPPGNRDIIFGGLRNFVPKVTLNMVSIPLSAFTTQGLDLKRVHSIELRFNARPRGAILISDLALTDPPRVTVP